MDSQVRNLGASAARLLAGYRAKAGWRAPDMDAIERIAADFARMMRPYLRMTIEDYRRAGGMLIPEWPEIERNARRRSAR